MIPQRDLIPLWSNDGVDPEYSHLSGPGPHGMRQNPPGILLEDGIPHHPHPPRKLSKETNPPPHAGIKVPPKL